MKKNKTEKCWWTGLTKEDMKHIPDDTYTEHQEIFKKYSKNKSKKSKRKKMSELWSDIYADVDRSPKKSKQKKRSK